MEPRLKSTADLYYNHSRCAKYCDERVCVTVVSVCSCIPEMTCLNSRYFLYMLSVAVARSSPDDNSIRHVLYYGIGYNMVYS